jgi:GxxExxY protein
MELQNKHLTDRIIAAAIRVHKELGPGFLETMYEEALAIELTAASLAFERQKLLPVFYREHLIGEHRLDFLVESQVIVELKAISALEDIHFAIVRSYLKAANLECVRAKLRRRAADREARRSRIPPNDQRRRSCPVTFLVSWFPD